MRISVRIFILMVICLSSLLFAQLPGGIESNDSSFTSQVKEVIESNVKFSGELGSQGELYSVSGRQALRPGQTGRLYFRPTLTLFSKFSFSLDLSVSNEGRASAFNNNLPKDLNSLGISPEWGWGKLYFGDFTMAISKFTLTDVRIKGYGIDLYPGIFKFMVYSGTSQKAQVADATNSLYERTVYGGKIGLGEEGGDHFHINFLRSYDDPKSLDRSIFRQVVTTPISGGAIRYDTNYIGISPQENLILGSNWSLGIFGNRFRTKNEVAVSVYTADMYAPNINNDDIPKDVSKFYTVRSTSSADLALSSDNTLRLGNFNFKGGFTYIGPGYTSLGMGTVINDKQVVQGGVGFTIFSGKLMFQSSLQKQNDNLAKQKRFTTNRDNYSIMASTRLGEKLSLTFVTNSSKLTNNATNDTLKLNTSTVGYTISTNYLIEAFKVKHTLDFSATVQKYDAKNVIRGNNSVASNSLNIGVNTTYTEELSSNISANFNTVTTDALSVSNSAKSKSLTGSLIYNMFQGKLQNTLTYSNMSSESSSTGVLLFRASYQLSALSSISLQSRGTFFKAKGTAVLEYNEYMTNLDWVFRF